MALRTITQTVTFSTALMLEECSAVGEEKWAGLTLGAASTRGSSGWTVSDVFGVCGSFMPPFNFITLMLSRTAPRLLCYNKA